MKTTSRLIVWRESVCAGDDCDAPHERTLASPSEMTLRQVAALLLDGSYLASISGDKATWILDGKQPLLVFAQQWTEPRFLVPPDSRLVDCLRSDGRPHLRFRYWRQVDPDRVFDCLKDGKPLPDKYGR
jgi:hypothetical protein